MKSIALKKGTLSAALLCVPALTLAQSSYDLPRTMPDTPPSVTTAPPPAPSTMGAPADTPLQRALADCDRKAVADRQACRDQVIAQINAGSSTAVKPANDCAGLTGSAAADCLKGGNPGGK